MKRSTKIGLIIAAALTAFGIVTVICSLMILGFDPSALVTVEYETNSYDVEDEFKDISIVANTEDIAFKHSEDGSCKVVVREESRVKHTVTVENETLTIESDNQKKWYDNIGVGFESTSITVYLPSDRAYGDLSICVDTGDTEIADGFLFDSIDISADTGDITNYAWTTGAMRFKVSTGYITVKGAHADSIDLKSSTGNITLEDVNCVDEITHKCSTGKARFENVNCNKFTSVGDTGDITLTAVNVTELLAVERDTGDVRFNGSDAAELLIETSTGDVEGTLLTEKIFFVSRTTGDVDVPESLSGGKCKITTSTGDVRITIE